MRRQTKQNISSATAEHRQKKDVRSNKSFAPDILPRVPLPFFLKRVVPFFALFLKRSIPFFDMSTLLADRHAKKTICIQLGENGLLRPILFFSTSMQARLALSLETGR